MPNRCSFSPQFKAQVVLELLSGNKSQAELCREHQLSPYLLNNWKDALAFENRTTDASAESNASRVAELERLLGQLTLEIDILTKGSSVLLQMRRKGGRS